MLKGLILIVAMLTASGIALIQTADPPADTTSARSPNTPADPLRSGCEIISPGIARVAPTADRLAALRDFVVQSIGARVRNEDGSRTVPSRRDTTLSWIVGRDVPGAPHAVRTTTTFVGAIGNHFTIETIETPGHDTLVLLSAAEPTGEPASTGPLVRALRSYFTTIAARPSA